jgi:hypothetical protein
VSGDLGPDRERDLHVGLVEGDGEDGTRQLYLDGLSPYARIFDEYSEAWEKNAEYNKAFLMNQQNWLNDRLRAKGHVFLNEVYDRLGLERTPAGQIVGWVWNGDYDNYIEFDLFNPKNEPFLSGRENSVVLDFNVDGPIQNLI